MTPPRYNEPGRTLFVTVQAASRSMRFLPTVPVRESIDYLFALLTAKYGLLIHEFLFMSNHWHLVATDPDGRISDFLQEFNSLLSRQLNALRGTCGVNFDRDPGIQVIVDQPGILKQILYTLCNPIAARLVKRLSKWKASSSLGLRYGEAVTFPRPTRGLWAPNRPAKRKGNKPKRRSKYQSRGRRRYRGRSQAPETASLTLARPPIEPDKTDAELRDYIMAETAKKVAKIRAELRRRGESKVLGWDGIMACSFLDIPATGRELFTTRPRVVGVDKAECRRVAAKIERFERDYRDDWHTFKTNRDVEFPYGTLQMVRRHRVRCATAPP